MPASPDGSDRRRRAALRSHYRRWADSLAIYLARAGDASLSRDGGPLRREGRWMRVVPFGLISLIALILALIPTSPDGEGEHAGAVQSALILFLVIVAAAMLVPWERLAPAWQGLIPFAYMFVAMLLRHAQGTGDAGYSVLYILPVAWLAMYSPAWQVIAGIVLSALLILLPPVLDGPLLSEEHYPAEDFALTVTVVLIIAFIAGALRFSTNAAATDSLTGLPNRRVVLATLRQRAEDAAGRQRPLSVAILDLDNFKHYNDSRGHDAGDRLLEDTALAWQTMVRDGDMIGRIGGEEFGLIIEGDVDVGREVAERLIHAVPDGQTASAGVALVPPGEDPLDALRRADRALYQSKHSGRARVTVTLP